MTYTAKITGQKLVIEIDLSADAQKRAGPSKTGKTKLLASSGGFQPIEAPAAPGLKFSLLVTVPAS